MLVLHGDADQVLPPDKAAKYLLGLIHHVQFAAIEAGPARHPLDPRQVDKALPNFLRS